MRFVYFAVSLLLTVSLITILSIQLKVGDSKTPLLGSFLSPQQGFWQNAEPADYNYNADLKFAGVKGKVTVFFDDRLVPHVYADNETDAYFVQGYLHAKFRLWQMDFETYAAAGRMSEIMGAQVGATNFVKLDKYFRRLGMPYAATQSLKKLEADPVTKSETDAYTAGVNAYISSLDDNKIPLEYKLLNYKPQPWSNLKTALFLKYMAYNLSAGEQDFEMTNAKNIFSQQDFEKLFPAFTDSFVPIVPKGTVFPKPAINVKVPSTSENLYNRFGDSVNITLPAVPNKNIGSNNWVVAGSKTKSGKPILCNDPHLGLNLPCLWYEMQITTPNFSVYGATLPGAPSVIVGFNDSCAWGVTNAVRDVKDYYRIQFKDSTMQEYLFNGKWVKSTFRNEVIKIKGAKPYTDKITVTAFGPIIFDANYNTKYKDGKYYAIRWTAHDASNELLTFNKLNRAKNYNDFLNALTTYAAPGQNFAFASKRGDIAIKQQGRFPAKWKGQGEFVMPGTDSSYMWQGFIPESENPLVFNPSSGFVSSANQLPVDQNYPYYVNGRFSEFREIYINRSLRQMNNITVDDMEKLQTNNYDVFAEIARPILLRYLDETKLNADEKKYVEILKRWNLRDDVEEDGATIFKIFSDSLVTAVFKDEFSKTSLPVQMPAKATLFEALIKDSAYKFVDDINTPAKETVRDVVLKAYKNAYQQIQKLDERNRLAWGNFKSTGLKHLLNLEGLGRLNLPIGGGEDAINATVGNVGPGWRMVVQLTEKTDAYGVFAGGESGNPGSKYYDNFVDTWVKGQYYKLLFLHYNEAKNSKNTKWTMTFSNG